MSTNNIIDEILEKADIVSIVSDYIKLEKAGSSYKGLCPFHNDSNPSFFVSPSKGVAKCMVCGTGGNAITILEKLAKISTKEAIRRLAERYQIKYDYHESKTVTSKKNLYQITSFAANYYNYYLNNSLPGKDALNYLKNREIDSDIINTFKIGLAPSSKSLLYQSLHDQGYSDLDMIKAGVIVSGDYVHDTFINRIIFPITDEENNVIGFSGRIYYESNDSKYFNSFENELFKKGEVIYNLFNALDSIRKNKRIIIMEGFMDVIAAYKAGLKECVSLMGTALTKEHIEKLKKYNVDIILCLDGDEAGQNATFKALNLLQKNGINAYATTLPNNLDPDEYIKAYGKDQFKDIFEKNLVDSYSFIYNSLKEKYEADKSNFINAKAFEYNVYEMLSGIKNQIIIEKIINKLAIDLSTDNKTINNEYAHYLSGTNKKRINDEDKKVVKKSDFPHGALKSYEILIRYMMFSQGDFDRIYQGLNSITASQARYIHNYEPSQLITLIYKYYNIDANDGYFELYFEFMSKIQEYFRTNNKMDIEKFLSPLAANLQNFYNDRLKNYIVSEEKKSKEISDCYNSLTCFVIQFGIKKMDEYIKKSVKEGNTADNNYYQMQKIELNRELDQIKRRG